MSRRTRAVFGSGMMATAGAGVIGLAAMTNPAAAHADDMALILGGSGAPIPGTQFVQAANDLYLSHLYPGEITSFYGATPDNPLGIGFPTPEGLYPLTGVHTLPLNYPLGDDGLPSGSTSVGQGVAALTNAIESNAGHGIASTVFGFSQSSTIAGLTMEKLEAFNLAHPEFAVGPDDVRFVLTGDPSSPNGGLLERFAGFETIGHQTVSDPLSLPSIGVVFDGNTTPSNLFPTDIYSLEYDGYTDFPRYPLNLLADINAFLGIQELHQDYFFLTPEQIAGATVLPGSDGLTDYYMIDQTPPLVALLPAPLQALLGPDLEYLINLGYGDGSQGYSVTPDAPADMPTPFGLFPDVSLSEVFTQLATKTHDGIDAYAAYLADPAALATSVDPATTGMDFSGFFSALSADPSATLTELVNAISTASSAAYSALLPTADIINALATSVPAYELSLFATNLAAGDLVDAFGLPLAVNATAITLAAGFEAIAIQDAATAITNAFAGLF